MSQPLEVPVDKRRDVLDPVPELRELGSRTPLFKDTVTGVFDWMAVGRDVVREILGDPERFSSQPPPDSEGNAAPLQPGSLLQSDPPDHTRLRRFVMPLFTVRRMQRLTPVVERIVAERLDVLERSGRPADLMRIFAKPVAGLTCAALLGLPRDDLPELSRLADHRASPHSPRRDSASRAYFAHILRLVQDRRRHPGDDVLGTLIRDHGHELDDEELSGLCEGIITGSLENSGEMIGLSTLALLRHPDQYALLRGRPELMDRAVEELLRYVSVVAAVSPRTAREDVTIAGHQIKAGEVVAVSVFAANRCPYAGAASDGLDITREPGSHLALGHGIHFCLGAGLARMQLRVALSGLLERFPGLGLGVEVADLRFRLLAPQYGVETLPVVW